MKKPYLLISGYDYYPSCATGDWIGCFETWDEANNHDVPSYHDWKEIIDLRKWTE